MIIVSPRSKGGWVCSEVFDHTTLIRFMKKRFGVLERNITPWRRVVCSDLISTFDNPNARASRLPSVAAYAAPQNDLATSRLYPNVLLSVPALGAMPAQEETGLRMARPLPYVLLQTDGQANFAGNRFALAFGNSGSVGSCFHARSPIGVSAGGTTGPWSYTVEAGEKLSDTWTPISDGSYEPIVNGPNSFFRRLGGNIVPGAVDLAVTCAYNGNGNGVTMLVTNNTTAAVLVDVADTYTSQIRSQMLAPGTSFGTNWFLSANYNLHDLIVTTSTDADFVRQYAGHVENGQTSASEPKLRLTT